MPCCLILALRRGGMIGSISSCRAFCTLSTDHRPHRRQTNRWANESAPAIPPLGPRRAHCFLVSTSASISCVSGFTAKCNFRHVRRLLTPCLRVFHSPSPDTFKPVLSTTTSIGPWRSATSKAISSGCPFGQRREVGNRHVHLHQLCQRTPQTFGLPIGKPKQLPQHQQAFNGRIAVNKRVPAFVASLVCSHASITSSLNQNVIEPRCTSDSLYFLQSVIF